MRRALVFSLLMASAIPGAGKGAVARTLDIYVIDVEGGEATLFVSPSGQSMLVDSGWAGFDRRDADRIVTVAKIAGIKQIDYLVVTHFHADHVGGVAPLAAQLPIRNFVDKGSTAEKGERVEAQLAAYAAVRSKGTHTLAKPGGFIPVAGLDIRIIAAGGVVIDKPLPGAGAPNSLCAAFTPHGNEITSRAANDEDDQSVSLAVGYGRFRTVVMGDLNWNREFALMCPANKVGIVDMYLVSHHGSETSGSPAFVHALGPRAGVMNNGPAKGGAVQTFQTLRESPGFEDLWQSHYSIAGTSEHNRPEEFIANLEPRTLSAKNTGGQPTAPVHFGPAHWTKISASDDGAFTVTNSRNGFSKTYAPRRAQGVARTVWDGVYSEPQAARGKTVYDAQCALCHSSDLRGQGFAPGLVEDVFASRWQDGNLGDLFTIVKVTMPQDKPASLTDEENAAIVAYLLRANHYPAGEQELRPDPAALKDIVFKRLGNAEQ